MTAKLDGTNGLIQSVDYPTLTTGFTYNWPSGYTTAVFNPGSTLASGTINFPTSSLVEGMVITFSSSQQITALSLSGGSASINNAVTFLPAKTAVAYVYRATGTTWWPVQSVPGTGSQLVSGTSQASTSGTSIDFTGIPSWVKRITVMFSGVSTGGTSNIQVQIGSGSISTTGYVSGASYMANGAVSTVTGNVTTGFLCTATTSAGFTRSGAIVITNISGNIWVSSGNLSQNDNNFSSSAGNSPSLSGTLDRIRITTVNGTDTFDAGSINILYE